MLSYIPRKWFFFFFLWMFLFYNYKKSEQFLEVAGTESSLEIWPQCSPTDSPDLIPISMCLYQEILRRHRTDYFSTPDRVLLFPATKLNLCNLFCCSQVEAMKIGAKEMKRAYKDVKLDQIDVCFVIYHYTVLVIMQQFFHSFHFCTSPNTLSMSVFLVPNALNSKVVS